MFVLDEFTLAWPDTYVKMYLLNTPNFAVDVLTGHSNAYVCIFEAEGDFSPSEKNICFYAKVSQN